MSPNSPRLAEKKASIGYTYEDSTVEELENSLEKRAGDEEDSEEDSNTDEDEVIPDIGNGSQAGPARRRGRVPGGIPGFFSPCFFQTWKWTWMS